MAWRVARSLDILLGQINTAFPGRNKASDGAIGDAAHASRSSDHNPWYGPGIVTARDYTHDPAHGVDIDRLSDELAASRDPRIKYIIANRLILDSRAGNRPWQWVRYTGSNPHTKHLHLSVMDNASCDDTRPWNLPMLGGTSAPPPSAPAAPGGIEDMALDTQFKDSFGNTQTVQSFMTEVMRKLNDLHYPAVAPGSVASRIPGDRNTTNVFDMIKDNTSWTNQTLGRVIALQAAGGNPDPQAMADALRPVLADVVGPVVKESVTAALGADNQAQAEAIVSEISHRLAEGSSHA